MNNVTPIDARQGAQSAKFTINVLIEGFPVQVEVEGKAEALKSMIGKLKAIGAEPPQPAASGQGARNGQGAQPAANAPKCPEHRSMMKKGRRGWYCPRKDDYGDYCQETA
jgi:hypothetical protein